MNNEEHIIIELKRLVILKEQQNDNTQKVLQELVQVKTVNTQILIIVTVLTILTILFGYANLLIYTQ